jgi:hypothetical protein
VLISQTVHWRPSDVAQRSGLQLIQNTRKDEAQGRSRFEELATRIATHYKILSHVLFDRFPDCACDYLNSRGRPAVLMGFYSTSHPRSQSSGESMMHQSFAVVLGTITALKTMFRSGLRWVWWRWTRLGLGRIVYPGGA